MDEKQIVAYADPWSVTAGDTLDVMVSCHSAGQYSAELVELSLENIAMLGQCSLMQSPAAQSGVGESVRS